MQRAFVSPGGVLLARSRPGPLPSGRRPRTVSVRRPLIMAVPETGDGNDAGAPTTAPATGQLSPEEERQERATKERERLQAAEKFVEVDAGDHVCINCGYLYEPAVGENLAGVRAGTAFEDLPDTFVCPVCKTPKSKFVPKRKTIAGFAENQKYGFGGNALTASQKNSLIFGSLLLFFLLLLSGYALD